MTVIRASASASSRRRPPAIPAVAAGYTRVLETDFSQVSTLPAPWLAYNFANGNASWGWYLGTHVFISGGVLHIDNSYEPSGPAPSTRLGYTTNGAGFYQGAITIDPTYRTTAYPYLSVNARIQFAFKDVITGGQYSHRNIPLRWPYNDAGTSLTSADGEEDVFESDGAPSTYTAFFHYSGGFVSASWSGLDIAPWHLYRMERNGLNVTGSVDGVQLMSYSGTTTTLPSTYRLGPVFQQEFPHTGPNTGTTGSEDWQIAWITIDVPA